VQGLEDAHRIVSSEAEQLILVDDQDNETGFLSKARCHDGRGLLHRAFSLFLFNGAGELLIQRRGETKRLWPGFWSNSCCSHPRRGESMAVATRRRLRDELNVEAALEFVYKFAYRAEFGDAGSENELCHVYLGRIAGEIRPNSHEIADVRFVPAADLARELDKEPQAYTPWFRMEWESLTRNHSDRLGNYSNTGD
jgi:isopentenyl-diphosphate Delta-isomerase